jgi:NAD(P)H-dependent FMN reductase
MKPKILVILGSVREGRVGEKVAKNLMTELKKRDDAVYELVDLKDYPMPLFDEAVPPSMQDKPHEGIVGKWQKKIAEGDGYIFVTAEYNRGIPSALKNAIDYIYPEWNKKAMAVVSYGNAAGGTRAAEQLRTVAIELQMAPIRVGIHISYFWEKFNEDGLLNESHFVGQVNDMSEQLVWWTNALKNARSE